jgi:N6-L-threonylcarbamoyladenine synthase
MRVLGIESSCDETAAALVESPLRVVSSVVASQIERHRRHGGVVPELAARSHVEALSPLLESLWEGGAAEWRGIDAVAVTQGPGLASSLLPGLAAGRALADRLGVPLYGVHHMEGHLLSLFLSPEVPDPESFCPVLVLLVTGGHTALVRMAAPGRYAVLGRSIDDAAGEALDKGARLLGLPYPGGPEIERLAECGKDGPPRFPLGMPKGEEALRRGGRFAFSFSGLKTALRNHLVQEPGHEPADVARAYQHAVMQTLVRRTEEALRSDPSLRALACVGGVARNRTLRAGLAAVAQRAGVPLATTSSAYCTDNAAMIAVVPLLRPLSPIYGFPEPDPNPSLQGLSLR